MLLNCSSLPLVSCFITTVHNFSPRCLIIFGLILFSRPVQRTRDQTAGFYLLVYSSVFLPRCPSAHSLETGTQVRQTALGGCHGVSGGRGASLTGEGRGRRSEYLWSRRGATGAIGSLYPRWLLTQIINRYDRSHR